MNENFKRLTSNQRLVYGKMYVAMTGVSPALEELRVNTLAYSLNLVMRR